VSASYVDVDNRQGARNAVEHLLATGRTAVATITGPQDMPAGIDRLTGYRDAIGEAFRVTDATLEATGDFTQESGARAMTRLRARRPDLDAVFAASDLMAAGALSVLAESGRKVPRTSRSSAMTICRSPRRPSPSCHVRQPIEEMVVRWPVCWSKRSKARTESNGA
jgi:DNA-binding LacI/PurR family transcriptional regulator